MDNQHTPGGSRIYKHTEIVGGNAVPCARNPVLAAEINAHIEKHLGKPKKLLNGLGSPFISLEVNVVMPAPKRPYYTLVTNGMSHRPMSVPKAANAPDRIELLLCIPASWELDSITKHDSSRAWPLKVLQMVACLPFAVNTWVGEGHTIPNDENEAAYSAETTMLCALVAESHTTSEAFQTLKCSDGTTVRFLALWFLNREEMQFKLEHGYTRLMERLIAANTRELLILDRPGFSHQIQIPDNLFGDSFASRPAGITVRSEDIGRPFKPLSTRAKLWMIVGAWFAGSGLYTISTPDSAPGMIVFGLALGGYGLYKAAKLRKVIKNLGIVFQHGALVPGIVVNDKEVYTTAVLVNMAHSGGDSYWVVQVDDQMVVPHARYGVARGSQVPTICGFYPADAGSPPEAMSRWATVSVAMAQLGNSDPAVVSSLLSKFSADEWKQLLRALECVPKPVQPGTYPVPKDIIEGKSVKPPSGAVARSGG
jgi:Suppressor of fused protein (SUFU)